MPIIRRTQPTTVHLKPSYQLGSRASNLARQGYSSAQVDKLHPARIPHGASYTRSARIASAARAAGSAPASSIAVSSPTAAAASRSSGGLGHR